MYVQQSIVGNIWVTIYVQPYMCTHICEIIYLNNICEYVFPYMRAHIWLHIYEFLNSHIPTLKLIKYARIWQHIYVLSSKTIYGAYMIICAHIWFHVYDFCVRIWYTYMCFQTYDTHICVTFPMGCSFLLVLWKIKKLVIFCFPEKPSKKPVLILWNWFFERSYRYFGTDYMIIIM